jgi:CVNH domain
LISLVTGASADQFPQGSYRLSCNQISFKADMLTATCKKFDGNFGATTSLPYIRSCVGDIQNIGGNLSCSRVKPPSGSYQASCTEIVATAIGIVTARCKTLSGDLNPTGIDSKKCVDSSSIIANVNGELRCVSALGDSGRPHQGPCYSSPCGLCTCPLPPPNVGFPGKPPKHIYNAQ